MGNRSLELLINLLFWAITSSLIIAHFSIQAQDIEIINGAETLRISRNVHLIWLLGACVVLSAFLFYGNLRLLQKLNHGTPPIQIVIYSSMAWISTGLLFLLLLQTGILPQRPQVPLSLPFGIITFYFATSLAYGLARVWYQTETHRQKLAFDKKKAELDLLRAQLQPHFLFNVLNNLLAQVDQQQNPALAESIDRLSGLLRYIVYETAAPTVSVRREIDFLRDYAALQRTRFTPEELDFQFTVEGAAQDQPIATGLLLPFLENAFKHGAYPEEPSWIVVKIVIPTPQEIQFSIRNSRHPRFSPASPTTGFGLQATRERLALVYPNSHTLDIQESASDYSVHLTLQTHARPDRR